MDVKDKLTVLLSAHQTFYELYQIRLNAVEKRLPIGAIIVSALFGSLTVVSKDIQVLYLCGIPIALIYLTKTTITHLESFEDLLRRIEEIEKKINNIVGEKLLMFQSEHPSRGWTVAGRFGRDSINSVSILSIMVLVACVYILYRMNYHLIWQVLYYFYVSLVGLLIVIKRICLKKYKYIHAIETESKSKRDDGNNT